MAATKVVEDVYVAEAAPVEAANNDPEPEEMPLEATQ
jgi:hypothetical protein